MEIDIASYLMAYHLPAIFVGSFFFGETVILTASFLAAQGWWSPFVVFGLSLIGTLASDIIWFLLGNRVVHSERWDKYKEKYVHIVHFLERKTGQRPYRALLFIKFMYGTRILTIVYLSVRKVGFWKFLLYDILSTAILLAVLIPIGYLAGKGYENLVHVFHNVTYGITALVGIFILYKLVTLWLGKKIVDEE